MNEELLKPDHSDLSVAEVIHAINTGTPTDKVRDVNRVFSYADAVTGKINILRIPKRKKRAVARVIATADAEMAWYRSELKRYHNLYREMAEENAAARDAIAKAGGIVSDAKQEIASCLEQLDKMKEESDSYSSALAFLLGNLNDFIAAQEQAGNTEVANQIRAIVTNRGDDPTVTTEQVNDGPMVEMITDHHFFPGLFNKLFCEECGHGQGVHDTIWVENNAGGYTSVYTHALDGIDHEDRATARLLAEIDERGKNLTEHGL